MEDKIKLSEYILACSDFEKNPEDQNSAKKINDFLNKVRIREYIPLKEKETISMEILNSLHQDFDTIGTATLLEVNKIIRGLLRYGINIENDLNLLSFNYFIIDSCYKYGLYDVIIEHCKKDYRRLCTLVDSAINVSNIERIVETASLFDEKSYSTWLQNVQDFKDILNKEEVQNFVKAVGGEAKEEKELLNSIREAALNQSQREYEYEKNKLDKILKFQQQSEEKRSQAKEEEDLLKQVDVKN